MKKEILVNSAIRKAIFDKFGCSYPTVMTALRFETNSLLAHHIREFALELGGALITNDAKVYKNK